jgi:thiamine biosynthesis lipoprotein
LSARALPVALALGLLLGCVTPPPREPVTATDGRFVMGTVLEVTLQGSDAGEVARALEEIFALASRLDARFTVYEPSSELSRLNAAAGHGPVAVDPLLAAVLSDSIAWGRLSGGAFDVSVGPLVEVWTRAAGRGLLPASEAIAEARARVGVERLRVQQDGFVELPAGMALDLGGVAKGWALDRMLPILRTHGIRGALLNFGQSSTWAFGAPFDAPGWRLLARAPQGGFAGLLTLRDQALSVSGSLGQWTEIEGRRYGHVLDPRSGWPLTRPRQALVLAPGAGLAEALSKALLVLGEVEGIAVVAAQEGCEGLLLDADGGHWQTPGWAAASRFEPVAAP